MAACGAFAEIQGDGVYHPIACGLVDGHEGDHEFGFGVVAADINTTDQTVRTWNIVHWSDHQ